MNAIASPEATPKDTGCIDSSPSVGSVPAQVMAGRLCIPCAVKNPDFKERAPSSTGIPFEDPTVRAWIEGRSFGLFRHPSKKLRCGRCGQEAQATYAPEEQQAA